MRALFLEHDHVSPPGPVADRFRQRGYEVIEKVVVPPDRFMSPNVGFEFPDPSDFDVIVPMGAPWGAWDDQTIGNWLLPEIEWLRHADSQEIPVLGICFGGQLLARAHGGSVAPAPRPEIGWSTVWSEVPQLSGPWFQFHSDRWETPPEAAELARNSRASQAFSLRKNLALQFHPEVVGQTLMDWINLGGRKQVERDGQDPDILIEHTLSLDSTSTNRANDLVDYFIDNYV